MNLGMRCIGVWVVVVLVLLSLGGRCEGGDSDIYCLRSAKASVQDTLDENKVLNVHLCDMGLQNCSSMTGLDLSSNPNICRLLLNLSSNSFSGPIPLSLAKCTFLNVLKHDNNCLQGQIGTLAHFKSFNVTNNLLSGQITPLSP